MIGTAKISPSAARALSVLRESGFEAYLAGGCVRDMLMGLEPKDWDIASSAEPCQVKAAFQESGFIVVDTGIKHGTVTAIIDREPFEITTFREDASYSDHRHPDAVTFARTLREDVSRRDFTMNALAFDSERGVIDYFGGAEDIRARIIRCVGDADRRFGEDALRILRALRFSSVLGFEIERGTAASARRNRELLRAVSAERTAAELTKLICGRNAAPVLLGFADVIGVVLPEILPTVGFEQHNRYHCFDVWRHTAEVIKNIEPVRVLRWAALFHDSGKPDSDTGEPNGHFYGHAALSARMADAAMRRLKFDNETREQVATLIEHHDIQMEPEVKSVRRGLNRFGEETLRQLLSLQRADIMGQSPEYRDRVQKVGQILALADQIIAEASCFSLRELAVDGNDMIALGLKGRQIGAALDFLLNAVIDEHVPNDRNSLLKYPRGRSPVRGALPPQPPPVGTNQDL